MAVGDFAGKVLRTTAGIMSEIDPKSTRKFLKQTGTSHAKMMQTSSAYSTGRKATNFLAGGIKGTASAMKRVDPATGQKNGLMKSLQMGHSTTKMVNGKQVTGLSAKKVAGTAVGVGVAGRAVTGGGLYRDRYGNVNVPGIPFV